MRRGLGIWIFLIISALVLYLFSNETVTLALLLALIAVLPASFGLLRLSRRKLEVSLSDAASLGNKSVFTLTIRNTGWLPIASAEVEIKCENLRTGETDPATGKAELDGDYSFKPTNDSNGGTPVTMTVTAAFDSVPNENDAPGNTAQGAVWLGTNGCFQVWTKELKVESGKWKVGEDAAWIDVEAEGVTPQTGVEYTFRFVFDYRKGMYSVAVQYGAEWRPLVGRDVTIAPTSFPLAVSASRISRVKFTGDGVFRSLFGEWAQKANGFRLTIQ